MSPRGTEEPPVLPWIVRGERTVLKDRWIDVTAEDCLTVSGAELNPFYLFNAPDFAHAVAVTPAGKLVMVRQYRHGARRASLEVPGGLVDAGEDPQAAAARELLEETGYEGLVGEVLDHGYVNPANIRNRTHAVLITGCRRVADPKPEPTEALNVLEVAWGEIPARIVGGEIVNPMHIAALLALHFRVGGGFARLSGLAER